MDRDMWFYWLCLGARLAGDHGIESAALQERRSVEQVVAEVGFGDDRYFRRVFRRRVGLTPGQFQRLPQ